LFIVISLPLAILIASSFGRVLVSLLRHES
jgi:hypothetical protein